MDIRHGWKILTHDGCSPLQSGSSLFNGPLPFTLPTVHLDTGHVECSAGWNYVADIPVGWQIAGMWSAGRPNRIFAVEASQDALQRGNKRRASSLTLLREATDAELRAAFETFSRQFGHHQTRMAQEQAAWYHALSRPDHDVAEVEMQLALALSARGLVWELKRFDNIRAVWDARAVRTGWTSRAVMAGAWDAWDAWDAWYAWKAWDDRAARAACTAWDAWSAWDARAAWESWSAWDAWDAWAAWAALTTLYARLMGWQVDEPDQYTVGIREAYRHGLAITLPIGLETLGWAMEVEVAHDP